jgi:hypothetical protein
MITTVKQIIKPLVPEFILKKIRQRQLEKQVATWEANGCPSPPPHPVKQRVIREYQIKSTYSILVETGTFIGDMIEAQKKNFKKIISIELSNDLYKRAKERFAVDKNVFLFQGDSGDVLPEVLKQIDSPAIFWLDGHYSEGITAKGKKECPIFEELDAIFNDKRFDHILLIDDARCFIGQGDYPTIDQLTHYIKNKNDKYSVEVKYDIIRYTSQ